MGYAIIVNIGDQYSDLKGGYCETVYKIPNHIYILWTNPPSVYFTEHTIFFKNVLKKIVFIQKLKNFFSSQ